MKLLSCTGVALIAYAIPALAGDLSVNQTYQTFSPSNLKIHVGDSVTFRNGDTVTRNITVKPDEGDANDLGRQKPGGAVSYKFGTKGTYRIVCSIHPRMKMRVNAE